MVVRTVTNRVGRGSRATTTHRGCTGGGGGMRGGALGEKGCGAGRVRLTTETTTRFESLCVCSGDNR